MVIILFLSIVVENILFHRSNTIFAAIPNLYLVV